MRWYIKRNSSQINFRVSINAGYNEKNSRSSSATGNQATQPEDDRTLVFLDNLSSVRLNRESKDVKGNEREREKATVMRASVKVGGEAKRQERQGEDRQVLVMEVIITHKPGGRTQEDSRIREEGKEAVVA